MRGESGEAARRAIVQLSKQRENIECFDCCLRKSSHVNLFNATFVCSFCGGILNEFGHVIKKIATANFTVDEVNLIQSGGNLKANTIWRNMSPQELALRMLEFQDLYGTREHLKDKYIRKKWYMSPAVFNGSNEKPKFKIQPRFISDPTRPGAKSIAPRKALDLSNSDGNFDVMFVKSPPRRNKEYPVEKFDSFGFSDKFSRMYIQHTTPQLVADKPLEAVSYSFDSFVPKIDKELREERQRTKALAKAAQEVDPFPVTQSVFPVTPQTSSVFLDAANDSDWHPDFFNRDLLSASPHVISQGMNSMQPNSKPYTCPNQYAADNQCYQLAADPFN